MGPWPCGVPRSAITIGVLASRIFAGSLGIETFGTAGPVGS